MGQYTLEVQSRYIRAKQLAGELSYTYLLIYLYDNIIIMCQKDSKCGKVEDFQFKYGIYKISIYGDFTLCCHTNIYMTKLVAERHTQ